MALNSRPWTLLACSVAARFPQAMLSVALLVHAEHLSGSLAVGGIVAGGFAIGCGVAGPWWGRLADSVGARPTLLWSAALQLAALCVAGAMPSGTATGVVIAVGAVVGIASPPVGACIRAALPLLLRDGRQTQRAYALDATAVELTFIAGPPAGLALGAVWSTGEALIVSGALLMVSTLIYVSQNGSAVAGRRSHSARTPRPAVRSASLMALVATMGLVGVLFGAVEVGIVGAAAGFSGSTTDAAPYLALWGVGSLLGGAACAWRGIGRSTATLAVVLAVLTVTHLALAGLEHPVLLAAGVTLAGGAIAPTYTTVYGLVDAQVPAARATEAFSWVATAICCGTAAGSAIAGILASARPAAAFVLAGAAGVGAVTVAVATLAFQRSRATRTTNTRTA